METSTCCAIGTVIAVPAPIPQEATRLGPLDPHARISITVALQLRHIERLKVIMDAARGATDADFAAAEPLPSDVCEVRRYLEAHGFTNLTTSQSHLLIEASGTVAQIEAAFHTELAAFEVDGRRIYANAEPAYIPQSLTGIVVAVLGLDDRHKVRPLLPKHTVETGTISCDPWTWVSASGYASSKSGFHVETDLIPIHRTTGA